MMFEFLKVEHKHAEKLENLVPDIAVVAQGQLLSQVCHRNY